MAANISFCVFDPSLALLNVLHALSLHDGSVFLLLCSCYLCAGLCGVYGPLVQRRAESHVNARPLVRIVDDRPGARSLAVPTFRHLWLDKDLR